MTDQKNDLVAPATKRWRRIRIHNRTSGSAEVALHLGDGVPDDKVAWGNVKEVPARETFLWGIRHVGMITLLTRTSEGSSEGISIKIVEDVADYHLVIDGDGLHVFSRDGRCGPDQPDGIRRVQVGCGPHNLFPDWWNVDIRPFDGIDAVMDATTEWPYQNLDFVYGEHFLEHLDLEGALRFLVAAGNSLRQDGVLRLTTPNLDWVMRSHYPLDPATASEAHLGTLAINRAFHGWGHQFLYSRPFLEFVLKNLGYGDVRFYDYGESDTPALRNLERHGGYYYAYGVPNLLVVEATNIGPTALPDTVYNMLKKNFLNYFWGGH